jgi:two-component system, LytTR family, sensor kinase
MSEKNSFFWLKDTRLVKTIYDRNQYFLNLLAVLVLLVTIRIIDWLAWTPPYPDKTKDILFVHMFEFISFLPFIFLLIYTYRWAIKRKGNLLLSLLVVFFLVFGPTLLKTLTYFLEITFWRKDVTHISFDVLLKYTPGCFLVILFLSVTYYLTHLKLQSAIQREAAHKAETLTRDIHLKMLRYQINPHFLFNVLNSIYALIDENTEKAKKLVVEMSEYYRYTLNKNQQTISIDKEVESIEKYLEIQKTRFEEEFHYEISVEEAVKDVQIPSFIIHLLIENAIKYGRKSAEQKLIICLSVKKFTNRLLISVLNTGRILNTTPNNENQNGTGNGIDNIKERLALFYNDNYSFSLKEENGWVIATIDIRISEL